METSIYDILLLHSPAGLACWTWWLFSLGAFLLGILLYWLLFGRQHGQQLSAANKATDDYHERFVELEAAHATLRYQYDEEMKSIQQLKASLQKCEIDKSVLEGRLSRLQAEQAAGAPEVPAVPAYSQLFAADNLQIVEGVGPKMEELLKGAGYASWALLSEASFDALRKLLDEAGYQFANPHSWPRQAQLAHENKWDDLIEFQEFLSAGEEGKGDMGSSSKVKKLIDKLLGEK